MRKDIFLFLLLIFKTQGKPPMAQPCLISPQMKSLPDAEKLPGFHSIIRNGTNESGQ